MTPNLCANCSDEKDNGRSDYDHENRDNDNYCMIAYITKTNSIDYNSKAAAHTEELGGTSCRASALEK